MVHLVLGTIKHRTSIYHNRSYFILPDLTIFAVTPGSSNTDVFPRQQKSVHPCCGTFCILVTIWSLLKYLWLKIGLSWWNNHSVKCRETLISITALRKEKDTTGWSQDKRGLCVTERGQHIREWGLLCREDRRRKRLGTENDVKQENTLIKYPLHFSVILIPRK